MTKPAITKRSEKGLALTYAELDTNFQNLKDATFGVTDGTNSKDFDLNSRITFTAGTNITLGVDPTTGAITINANTTGNVQTGLANRIAFYPSNGNTIDDTTLDFNFTAASVGNPAVTRITAIESDLALRASSSGSIIIGDNTGAVQIKPFGAMSIIGGLGVFGQLSVINQTSTPVGGTLTPSINTTGFAGGSYNAGQGFAIDYHGLLLITNNTTGRTAIWLLGNEAATNIGSAGAGSTGTVSWITSPTPTFAWSNDSGATLVVSMTLVATKSLG